MRAVFNRWYFNRELRIMLNIPATNFNVGRKIFTPPWIVGLTAKPQDDPVGFAENRIWTMTTWRDKDVKDLMEGFR